VQSKKYQLINFDWRSLRDTPFEDFLQEVFETLGYTVETTKASGDQGIDLIVHGRGRKIGVQAKGYSGNVGNHSVMEAHAGMGYYRCDSCMVVTNSDFTRHAKELAHSLGCCLIAGKDIPKLIQGQVSL
jgi:HJR/Mrr/RecB family endonuclease